LPALHFYQPAMIDSFQADRGPERRYVTTPLRALFDIQKIHEGGFDHDGRRYDNHLKLKLTAEQKLDSIEYLKSL
jgi:hypothetical protein